MDHLFLRRHRMLRRLARHLGIGEPIAPQCGVMCYRQPSSAEPVTRNEVYRQALSHAALYGLQGEPRGFSIQRVRWERYARLVGMSGSDMKGHRVWVVALAGEIEYRNDDYPYMAMVLDLSGNLMCLGLYPPGNPVPYAL